MGRVMLQRPTDREVAKRLIDLAPEFAIVTIRPLTPAELDAVCAARAGPAGTGFP